MNPRTVRIALSLFTLSVVLGGEAAALGQPPRKDTRESLVQRIKDTARRHVENHEQMKSEFVLKLYEKNSAGLTPADIVETYETEYSAQKKELASKESEEAKQKEIAAKEKEEAKQKEIAAKEKEEARQRELATKEKEESKQKLSTSEAKEEPAAKDELASRLGIWDIVLRAGWFAAIVLVGVYLLRRYFQRQRLRLLIAQAEASAPRPREHAAPASEEGVPAPAPAAASGPPARFEMPAETNRTSSTLSRQLAGMRVLRGYALNCYRAAVNEDFKDLTVQFDPERPLSIASLYVAPRIREGSSEIDAFTAVARYQRLLLKAPSGAGKSVLLRWLALTSFQEGIPNLRGRPNPVLVELRRFTSSRLAAKPESSSSKSLLEQELIQEFDRRGFPHADIFLTRALGQGRLLFLFDGLDDVNPGVRTEVARLIKDLLRKYPRCRAVITCRSDVYRNEFTQAVDATLDLEELSDQQVRDFLGRWKQTLPADHPFSVDRFLKVVYSRERLIPLIRNPLLLTMLVYLHTQAPERLPDSRTAIFEQCRDFLLSRSSSEQTPEIKEIKNEILASLARLMQENAEVREGDGLSVDHSTAVREARRIQSAHGRNSSNGAEAEALLRALLERDCLLVPANGGYRFRHRAFQDYFAAVALKDDPAGLVQRFRRSPATWLKTVKLWCGMDHDSSDVLTAIFAEDPLTALICLGEAKQVNAELANRIFAAFKDRLGSSTDDALLCRAFAMATHQEQYGEEVFRMLLQTLSPNERPVRRAIAARALALSNTARAAGELAKVFSESPEFRQSLQDMGDLAVPVLAELTKAGNWDALDALRAVGTPSAALALVPLLWSTEGDLAVRAAWRLAALLQRKAVETALDQYEFPDGRPAPGPFDWIWDPFTKSPQSPLPLIAGHIAFLLERAPIETAPPSGVELDPRIVIPLCGIIKKQDAWRLTEEPHAKMRSTVTQAMRKSTGKRLSGLKSGKSGPIDVDTAEARSQFVALVLHLTQPTKTWQYLFDSLKPEVQFNFLFGLFQGPSPRRLDWLEIASAPSWLQFRSRNPLRAFPMDGVAVQPVPAATNSTPARASVASS
jgi:hypothetical protein